MRYSYLEKKINNITKKILEVKIPFLSSICAGLLAHGYAFTNKLPNADELWALFTKGATTTSGRWALELTKFIFPNYSMPWIYGIFSLIFLALSVCILINFFDIKSKLLQILLSVVFVTFPSTIGMFAFMFTAASYSFAILLSTISMYFFSKYDIKNAVKGCIVFSIAISIYQANVPFIAAMLVVYLLEELLFLKIDSSIVFKHCVYYFAILLFSVFLYSLELKIVCALFNIPLENDYGFSDLSLLTRLRLPYSSYAGIFLKGYYGYARNLFVCSCYIICLIIVFFVEFKIAKKMGKKQLLLYFLLIAIYPYAVNSLYLIAEPGVIHSLSQYSFSSVFFLFAILLDSNYFESSRLKAMVKDIALLSISLVFFSNVYLANQAYLKMYLNYESAISFYSTLLSDIHSTPGYTKESPVVLIGNPNASFYDINEQFSLGDLFGPSEDLRTVYTYEWLIRYYLGSSINLSNLNTNIDISDMPTYPDYGSIKSIDGVMIVKFS